MHLQTATLVQSRPRTCIAQTKPHVPHIITQTTLNLPDTKATIMALWPWRGHPKVVIFTSWLPEQLHKACMFDADVRLLILLVPCEGLGAWQLIGSLNIGPLMSL